MRILAIFFLMTLIHDVSAQSLFSIDKHSFSETKTDEQFNQAIQITANPGVLNLDTGDSFTFSLPDTTKTQAVISSRQSHSDGVVSIRAADQDGNKISFSMQAGLLVGSIETASGVYRLGMHDGQNNMLMPSYLRDLTPVKLDEDFLIPERSRIEESERLQSNNSATASSKQDPIIDLMYVYTDAYANDHGGALGAQMAQITNEINSYLEESGVAGRFRLVHTQKINYPNSNPTFTALESLTQNTGAFSEISNIRNSFGADLVVLLRKFTIEHFNENICGLAWLNGLSFDAQTGVFVGLGDIPRSDSAFGYSVVHQGIIPSVSFCDSSVLAHEIGHNMGLNHDVQNLSAETSAGGVFPYSKGYFVTNKFHTIMSNTFTGERQFEFSNPNQFCQGLVCGVSGNGSNSANAALSLTNVFPSVAAFTRAADMLVPMAPIINLISDD